MRNFLLKAVPAAALTLVLVLVPGISQASQASFRFAVPFYAVDNVLNEMDAAPFLLEGRFFVPVRYTGLVCGIENKNISYDSSSRTVSLVADDGTNITMTIGKKEINVSGKNEAMDVTPVVVQGRVYLPIRYIAEALNRTVSWDGKNLIVTVEMEDYLAQALEAMEKEQYELAFNLCNKLAGISPRDFRPDLFRGVTFYQQGNYHGAIAAYNKSLEIHPENPITYIVRAEARWPLFRQEADKTITVQTLIDDVSKAIELSEDPMYYFRRAGLYNYAEEYDKAIADCDKAISLDSEYRTAYYRKAIALALRDGNEVFKTEIEAILERFPGDEWAKNSLDLVNSGSQFQLDVTDW